MVASVEHKSKMGQRRPMQQEHGAGFPMKYLLPLALPHAVEDSASPFEPEECGNDADDDFEELSLYRQAVPLLHPQSTSAARTIGKMLGDNKIAQRMLQRNQMADTTSATAPTSSLSSFRRLRFHKACEEIFFGFDPVVKRTGKLPASRIRLLLRHYGLEVDEVMFRQWEQSLPTDSGEISPLMFIQGCTTWFHEQFLINHYTEWLQIQHRQTVLDSTALEPAKLAKLGKCQSAPQLLHPFDALARHNDDANAFSYADYAHRPPRQQPTQIEKYATKSQAMISATQQLRRSTKIVTHLKSTSSLDTSSPIPCSSSAPHDRLHEEKLARHILQRCGAQALAPSNRRKSSLAMESISTTSQPPNSHAMRVQRQAARKLLRQQNAETAKAFSASIAMISRHVHNEELRDLREITYENQLTAIHERKQLRHLQSAHCKALVQEKAHQQIRDVAAMKTLAQEESELAQQFAQSREQQLRLQKPQFALSSSTSTLFQQPPEILAAKATAKTNAQKKRLHVMEKEHLDHMRSIQLMDFAYDKKRAMEEANEPKADASLLNLTVENLPEAQEVALATQELWQQILETCHESQDMTPLIPPPNSPPAAMRFFSSAKLGGFLPPFTASPITPSAISKVP